jgi:hypothetical protein
VASRVMATFSLLPRPRQTLQRACRGLARGVWAWAVAGDLTKRRGKGMGGEWRVEERWGQSRGFYTLAVDSVLRGLDHLGLGSEAVLSRRRRGLNSVVWTRSSVVCRANGPKQKFRRRAGFSCHGREAQVVGRAGRGWRVVRAAMSCRCMCGERVRA